MKSPNMAPRPPPMTPAITVLPTQDSIPICIYDHRQLGYQYCLSWAVHTAFTICCSCSDMPAIGFIEAGIAPGPPGNAMAILRREGKEKTKVLQGDVG